MFILLRRREFTSATSNYYHPPSRGIIHNLFLFGIGDFLHDLIGFLADVHQIGSRADAIALSLLDNLSGWPR